MKEKAKNFTNFLFVFTLISLNSCYFIQKTNPVYLKWPLKKYQITQKYKVFKKSPHLGLDLKAPLGTPVLSTAEGRVIYAGKQFSGYGNVVIIEHRRRWTSLYAHLHTIKVKLGQKVRGGETIGTVGNTGKSTGVHLHFELLFNKKNVNPINHLKP